MVPIVGFIEGLIIGLIVYSLILLAYEPIFIGSIYIASHILLTGGIHMDGFSDYIDLIGSRAGREKARSILKDPKKGSFAIMGVAINIMVSTTSISLLVGNVTDVSTIMIILIATYIASSEAMYIVLKLGKREPYSGLADLFHRYVSRKAKTINNIVILIALTIFIIIISELLNISLNIYSLTAIILSIYLLAIAISLIVLNDAHKRLGYVSGDVAGFLFEVSRLTILIFISTTITSISIKNHL